ncbi:hypothetical protein EUA93_00240 [Nocardioides oleivorans]|uniref:Hyalin n=1 Tax=Nocardioides oleivorans TaxID=273676 RepID=A0A4Q2RYA8_9ACTN|nr:ELWxxDGT repeat protein [Nocardioides oleivorans]RYB92919.1 hypothetical protein EUA93_00240 [Nocardioides oleivorans]
MISRASLSRAVCAAMLLALVAPASAEADQLTVRGAQVFTYVAPDSPTQFGNELAVFQGFLYFVADDGVHGRELWRTDGTDAGTALVGDLYPGLPGTNADPHRLTVVGDRLFFNARSSGAASSETVFYIEASTPTTIRQINALRATDNAPVPAVGSIFGAPNGRVVISRLLGESSNCCYAVYALPPGGTAFAKISVGAEDINANNVFSPSATAGGWTYYSRSNTNVSPGQGSELWRTNGATTEAVADIRPGTAGSAPSAFVATGNRVYFTADDGTRGRELWVTNPADKSDTHLVHEHVPGAASTSINDPGQVANGNVLYYVPANDPVTGPELWRTDGTEAGTRVVKDLTPGTGGYSVSTPFAFRGGVGLLRGSDVFVSSDGTDAGTALLGSVDLDGVGPNTPVVLGDRAYFVAGATPFGQAVWRTDGTEAGTFPLTAGGFDGTGAASGSPSAQTLAVLGSRLIFFGRDPGTNASGAVKMYVLDTTLPDEQRVATVAPAVTGTPAVGSRLDVSRGTWSGRPTTFTYQWLRNGQPIANATSPSYGVVAADAGQRISARVTTTGIGAPRTASADSGAVTIGGSAGPTPTPTPTPTSLTVTRKPSLKGRAEVGSRLKVTLPRVAQSGVKMTVRWFANGKAIKKQTKTKLKLTRKQVGKRVTATITLEKSGFRTLRLKVGPSRKVTD